MRFFRRTKIVKISVFWPIDFTGVKGAPMAKKILVIDDEVFIAKIISYTLEDENYNVLIAHDGKEGLRLAMEAAPDLIVLDLMLPNIDGYEICRLLKLDEKYRHIPIIMLSARKENEDKRVSEEIGVDCFLGKPFSPDELVDKVHELIR